MSMNEPPPTLMSLPKEIRLRIMEMASEDILPEMELIFSGGGPISRIRFSQVHGWSRAAVLGDVVPLQVMRSSPDRDYGPGIESSLYRVCQQLRDEFLATVFSVQDLHIDHKSTQWMKQDRVECASLVPVSYRPYIRGLSFQIGIWRRVRIPMRFDELGERFPSLRLVKIFLKSTVVPLRKQNQRTLDDRVIVAIKQKYRQTRSTFRLDSMGGIGHEVLLRVHIQMPGISRSCPHMHAWVTRRKGNCTVLSVRVVKDATKDAEIIFEVPDTYNSLVECVESGCCDG